MERNRHTSSVAHQMWKIFISPLALRYFGVGTNLGNEFWDSELTRLILLEKSKMAKSIVVFGATGSQGSGAVSALLKQGKFSVRAVTRDPKSAKSAKLAAEGAELVSADFEDKKSIDKVFFLNRPVLWEITLIAGTGMWLKSVAHSRDGASKAARHSTKEIS